jgi:dolichol-phosphate mannosyltransferase
MKLSVVIPAHNEEGCIAETLDGVLDALRKEAIPFEVIVVDDACTDGTAAIVAGYSVRDSRVRLVVNPGRHGFGMAVRKGLEHFEGDAVAIVMADASDSPRDLVRYYFRLREGLDCVFGSRFIRGASVVDYPKHKFVLNRLANAFIRTLFRVQCNDITNAFKIYRREVVEHMYPLISPHFNLTVEMPLKAIVRGFSYDVIPISWTNRKAGVSKLKLKEMGSRYLFIVLYLLLEKHLSRNDYRRSTANANNG